MRSTTIAQVQCHIGAPIDQVFNAIADHEIFLGSQQGITVKILQPGNHERNGLGCVREVRVGVRTYYVEEITAWDRPKLFEYTIRETSLPLRHEVSRLVFMSRDGGTDVEWSSRFSVMVPLIGRLLDLYFRRQLMNSFARFLAVTKSRLEHIK